MGTAWKSSIWIMGPITYIMDSLTGKELPNQVILSTRESNNSDIQNKISIKRSSFQIMKGYK
eukprot:snap_masked-scaffold_44-processed-gene-0.12-mRNA-1 protein AED:1.00 eAED:1.00 QI:0/0/0/0/1/1/2/0/61